MTEINYSALLRELVDDYLAQHLSRIEYVTQRRDILDRIDFEFNGELTTNGRSELDITQPQRPIDNGSSSFSSVSHGHDYGRDRDLFD